MREIRFLYLGQYYDVMQEYHLLKVNRRGLSGAGNTVQHDLMKGFIENLGPESIEIHTTLPAAMYPKNCKQMVFKSELTHYPFDMKHKNIGFINLPFIKEIGRLLNFYKKIIDWYSDNDALHVVFTYALYSPILLAINLAKIRFPTIKTCLMVNDLPNEYGITSGRTGFMKKMEEFDGNRQMHYARKFDTYVFMAPAMKEVLNTREKPYCIVEAIAPNIDKSLIKGIEDKYRDKNIIMYAGWIKKEYNFDLLISAFEGISDPNLELWLCGATDMEYELNVASNRDSRIKYFGYVSKSKVLELQEQATIMINPRGKGAEYTRFSFPSKTMEAIVAGKPLICFKLKGIPDEYDQYLYYVPNESVQAIKNTIQYVLNLDPKIRQERSFMGKQFVSEEKNAKRQCQKIIQMLTGLD